MGSDFMSNITDPYSQMFIDIPVFTKINLGFYPIHKSHNEEIKIYLEFFLNFVQPNILRLDATDQIKGV